MDYSFNNKYTSKKKKNILLPYLNKRLIFVISLILLLAVAFHLFFNFVIVYNFRIKTLDVICDCNIDNEEILKFAGIKNELYFFVDTDEIERNIARYPVVENVTVKKVFPNKLVANIESRKALVVSFFEVDGKSVPILIDKEGIVFQVGLNPADQDLPILSGVNFVNLRLGTKLTELSDILNDLQKIREENNDLFYLISELEARTIGYETSSVIGNMLTVGGIETEKKQPNSDKEFLVYLRNESVPVRIGNYLTSDMILYMKEGFDVLKQKGINDCVFDLDFRTKELVYKKEKDCG